MRRDLPDTSGPWSAYRLLVIESLDAIDARLAGLDTEIDRRFGKLDERLRAIEISLMAQKVKVGIIGAAAGTIFGAVAAAIARLVTK